MPSLSGWGQICAETFQISNWYQSSSGINLFHTTALWDLEILQQQQQNPLVLCIKIVYIITTVCKLHNLPRISCHVKNYILGDKCVELNK